MTSPVNSGEGQPDMFPVERPTAIQIIEKVMERKPVAIFALFSGGDGSLAATHWAMNNIPGCRVAHVDTGIGIPATQEFVRETCAREGWPLTIMRAKEDCGKDYEEIVRKHGFPGPASHLKMYSQLKERAIRKLVARHKTKRADKVALLTGVCHDDSRRRSGYGGAEITAVGAQLWVNPQYWSGRSWTYHYLSKYKIPRNPVSEELGMSGECLCGAFAEPGELAIVRRVCPATADRIEALQQRIHNRHPWGWEQKPPKARDDDMTIDMFAPMCVDCIKSPLRSQQEAA